MFKLGLTGSIGMGKSTTAQIFADEGCAVWDADAAVHRLYAKGGAAVEPIGRAFPSAVVSSEISREKLKTIISEDSAALAIIEQIVHPLVQQDRMDFISAASNDILVFDIPLLFENGGETKFDAVATVFIDADTQRKRVMARETMTADQFEMILSKQLPAKEKKNRADYVIVTDTLEHARQQVQSVLAEIRKKLADA